MHIQRPFHGTAVYTRFQCEDEYPKSRNMSDIEITIIKLKCLPNVVIASIYRPPRVQIGHLHDALKELHSIISTEQFCIILGDFNIDFNNDVQTRRFAACTQAVVILRSTSYIAIELNVLHLKLYAIQSHRCA